MKKISIKPFRVPSPHRDGSKLPFKNNVGAMGSTCNQAFKTNDCQEDSGQNEMPSDIHPDTNLGTPKRKAKNGLFKTLRRKFTPSRKKDENVESSPSHAVRSSRWHTSMYDEKVRVERLRSGSHSADRAMRRSRQNEFHSHTLGHHHSHGNHRQCNTHQPQYPGSLNRPRKNISLAVHSTEDKQKSETDAEKECEDVKLKTNALFPFDTEYGHTSAPFNEEDIPLCFEGTPVRGSSPPHCSRSQELAGPSGSQETGEPYDSSGDSQQSIGVVCAPIPVYDQVKEPPKDSSWSLSKELFKLSKFGWYWGPITRVEGEEKLADQPDGAFLVRDSSDERYLLSLSFRSYGRTLHTRIEHCNGVFSFYAQPECEGYSSIVDLIEHSMNDSQTGVFCYSRARTPGSPSFPVRLTKPVSRFTHVRSLQYLCRFVIRQYTRFDHIQTLPLPTSIKGWLQENQY